MNPFDIVSSVSYTKKRIIDSSNESEYNAFIINRALSYYPDTIMHAQEMNINSGIDLLLQHDYYLNSLRPKKRFSKWYKKEKDTQIEAIMLFYQYNRSKAQETISILSTEQIDQIVKVMKHE